MAARLGQYRSAASYGSAAGSSALPRLRPSPSSAALSVGREYVAAGRGGVRSLGATDAPCPDVAIYGARGSGEDYLASQAGMGPTVAKVSDRLLHGLPPTMRVLQVGLTYPAVTAASAIVGNSATYKNSVSSGAETLAHWLGQDVTRCPHVKIVLIGLSQGANVLEYMLTAAPQPTPVTRRIAAILLYGDPVRQPGKSYNVGPPDARGALVSPGLQPPTPNNVTPSIPPYLAGATQSYCLAHDPICGFTTDNFLHHLNVHSTYGQSPYVAAGAAFAVARLLPAVGPGQSSGGSLTRTVSVPGAANIFGAGHAVPPDPGGYHLKSGHGGGTLPPAAPLPTGVDRVLTISATGGVSCDPGAALNGPDGGCGGSTDINSYGGIAGIVDGQSAFFLMGVFLGPTEPHDPAPPRLNFSSDALGQNFARLTPAIGQTFFIGDGMTGTGTGARQQFVVPAGATRLFLGFADTVGFHGAAGWYDDNRGQLSVMLRVQPGASGAGFPQSSGPSAGQVAAYARTVLADHPVS